jgi:hypothetical protein
MWSQRPRSGERTELGLKQHKRKEIYSFKHLSPFWGTTETRDAIHSVCLAITEFSEPGFFRNATIRQVEGSRNISKSTANSNITIGMVLRKTFSAQTCDKSRHHAVSCRATHDVAAITQTKWPRRKQTPSNFMHKVLVLVTPSLVTTLLCTP